MSVSGGAARRQRRRLAQRRAADEAGRGLRRVTTVRGVLEANDGVAWQSLSDDDGAGRFDGGGGRRAKAQGIDRRGWG